MITTVQKLTLKNFLFYQLTLIIPIFIIFLPFNAWWMWVLRVLLSIFVFIQVYTSVHLKEWEPYGVGGWSTVVNVICTAGLLFFLSTWITYIFVILFALNNTAMAEKIKKVNSEIASN